MKRLQRKNGTRDSSGSKKISWNVFKNQAREFCLATGLHGYKYVAQSQRSKIERTIWAIILLGSLCCAIVLMKIAWNYYASHPTLTVIETTHRGIWNYPFPAVTICNINRISLNLTRGLVDMLSYPSNMSKEFLVQEFRLLLELLDPGVFEHDVTENLTRLQDIIDDNGLTIREVMEKVTKNCSDLLISCKWNDESFECNEFFNRILTRDGICCSFNYISPCDVENSIDSKPRKIQACGYQTGLTVKVNPDPEDYFATILGSYGVKVLVHYPYDYPDHNANDKLIDLNKQAFLSVSPEETYATLDVKDLAISTRNCVFSDEGDKILKDEKVYYRRLTSVRYSYINCMAECRANTIRNKCDCIPYYFPSSEARVCNLKDVKCLSIYRSWYDTSWPGQGTEETILEDGRNLAEIYERPCGCIPDCTLFQYPVDVSQGILDTNISFDGFRYLRKTGKHEGSQNQSIIHVFFSDLIAIQYRRRVRYNWRNLFASFGGLLGLFVGFSLMSGFELIYFFVIRIITDRFANTDRENRNES
ncbi:sodium channel protein Nach-like isoform X2 [Vespa velutina]|uniref:sodium channel protein Nach-like isoform X2 n=1 Tax=Vespa velutina TaxID=202808 RepID=UPI001FB3444F|nr:sodium channel protein Nach-like isoform X2 [Vespa velutina]